MSLDNQEICYEVVDKKSDYYKKIFLGKRLDTHFEGDAVRISGKIDGYDLIFYRSQLIKLNMDGKTIGAVLAELTTPPKPYGVKHDSGKLRYDLIPSKALAGIANVLTYGATKYGDRNWEQGIDFDRLYAAHQRHIESYRQGEVLDPESKLNHILHAITNLVMAYELSIRDASPKTTD